MKKFLDSKQRGPLYHIMSLDSFEFLLKRDVLRKDLFSNKPEKNIISFSRKKDYNSVVGMDKFYSFKIEVDGDQLSNRYKIVPFQSTSDYVSYKTEAEEIIYGPIKDIGRYIKKIIFVRPSTISFEPDAHSRELLSGYLEKYKQIVIAEQEDRRIVISNDYYDKFWKPKSSWKELNIKYSGVYDQKTLKRIKFVDYSKSSVDLFEVLSSLVDLSYLDNDDEDLGYMMSQPKDSFSPDIVVAGYILVSASPFSESILIWSKTEREGNRMKLLIEKEVDKKIKINVNSCEGYLMSYGESIMKTIEIQEEIEILQDGKKIILEKGDKIRVVKESSERECFIFKAKDKNWYYFIADREYGEYPDGSFYGPFQGKDEAIKHLNRTQSNPGGFYVDSSGKESVPSVRINTNSFGW